MPGPSLDRIARIVKLLDHPELTYPSIHVTGTNGKTTTARIVTALACAQGLATGTFVSPHVESITERLSVCGRAITEEELGDEYEHLLPYLDAGADIDQPVTYFEALTALAYLWFADKPVALGVFEVGMGGTWDATNLVRGDVAVICPIGLDHVGILGSTVGEIATEKAGIVKEGRVAVVREQRPEALEVIRARAEEVGATLLLEGEAFGVEDRVPAVGGQSFRVRGLHATYDDMLLPLFGEPQARNAGASIVALEALLGRALDERLVRQTLATVASPGRVEVVGRRPLVVLDGAHNLDAMEALARTLRESFTWERLHAVVAMFADKDVEGVTAILGPLVDVAHVARTSSPRAAPVARVAAGLREGAVDDVRTYDGVDEAVEGAREAATADDLVLVTGSFYTVAEARPMFVGG
jgi:dihydrofolate synthase / folylpolyglutamate synthase